MSHPQNILLTGASRGIGYQTAGLLASAGHRVFCVARSRDKLEELAGAHPGRIVPLAADLSRPGEITALMEEVKSRAGHLDVLIHNAGGITVKPFGELTDEDWQYQLDVNLMSAVRLFREAVPWMNGGSHMLAISSMGGFQGSAKFPGLTAYSVSKGALAVFTECLAAELAPRKVAVNCLCLGSVQTEMLETAFPGLKAPVSAPEMAAYIADFGLGGHQYYNGKILPVSLSDPG
ncbi:MAG: SDR family oxidoreductase [Balneolales bacterium]